jgi:hypothetical protein
MIPNFPIFMKDCVILGCLLGDLEDRITLEGNLNALRRFRDHIPPRFTN